MKTTNDKEEKQSELERACKAILLEFYGESDSRAYDLDRLAVIKKGALWLLERAREIDKMRGEKDPCDKYLVINDLEALCK